MMRALKVLAVLIAAIGTFLGFFFVLAGLAHVHQWGSGRFWNFADDAEAFLLPEGYRGGVTLVFGDSTAPPTPREGIARLYDFRGGPVLRVRETAPSGHRTPDWYFVDSRGRRRHFLRGARCDDRAVGTPLVCRPTGRSVAALPGRPVYEFETWAVVGAWREVGRVENGAADRVNALLDAGAPPR